MPGTAKVWVAVADPGCPAAGSEIAADAEVPPIIQVPVCETPLESVNAAMKRRFELVGYVEPVTGEVIVSTGFGLVQARVSVSVGHAAPPPAAGVMTVRVRA